MIKHIVMWRLKEEAENNSKTENAKKIKKELEALKGEIKEVVELEVGINIVEDVQAYDLVLYSVFNTKDDLKKYAMDPRHVKVANFIKSVAESRVVVDYEN